MTQRFCGPRKQKVPCPGLVCLVIAKGVTGHGIKNSNVLFTVLKYKLGSPRSRRAMEDPSSVVKIAP